MFLAVTKHGWRILAALTVLFLISIGPCRAQAPEAANGTPALQKELVIGTKEAPPFAMKDAAGNWSGISIDLWRRVADELHLRYRFAEEPNVQGLIDGVVAGKYDAAVAALTVTAARENLVDFTQPFYVTGLGIAVPTGGEASWAPVIHTLTSFGFAQAVMALVGLALAVGLVIWLFERRHNEQFGGGVAKGLSSGIWWSTVAMTQRYTGEIGPRTLPGRLVAIIWMVGSIVTIAIFTASVTSSLTIKHLQGRVHEVGDLPSVRVGAVAGTSTEDTLSMLRISYRKFAAADDGLTALRARSLDAFVYDKPLLAWIIRQHFSSSIQLIDTTFETQDYAFALPNNSPLEKALNVAILQAIQGDWWQPTVFRYIGSQ
jgi:polar amino acid transport system substrate-binding protein